MPRAIHTALTNETEGHRFGDLIEPLADTFMGEDASMGEIYRAYRAEYGRCMSKVYVDVRVKTNDEGGERWEVKHVGWFFVSRQKYEDCAETYLRGAWVTVGEYEPAREASVTL